LFRKREVMMLAVAFTIDKKAEWAAGPGNEEVLEVARANRYVFERGGLRPLSASSELATTT